MKRDRRQWRARRRAERYAATGRAAVERVVTAKILALGDVEPTPGWEDRAVARLLESARRS